MNISNDMSASAAVASAPAQTLQPIDVSGFTVQHLDVHMTPVEDIPPEQVARLRDFKYLQGYEDYVKANIHNEAPYAYVMKDGKVIATLDNGGGAETYSTYPVQFDVDGGPPSGGPAMAQWRAEQIAKTTGGQIVMAQTAQSPATWKPQRLMSFQAYIQQQLAQEQGASGADGTARVDVSA